MSEKAQLEIREPVAWFAFEMEKVLRTHDKDRGEFGWREDVTTGQMIALWRHLQQEVAEAGAYLDQAFSPRFNRLDAIKELVDIANMAMMLADNMRGGERHG